MICKDKISARLANAWGAYYQHDYECLCVVTDFFEDNVLFYGIFVSVLDSNLSPLNFFWEFKTVVNEFSYQCSPPVGVEKEYSNICINNRVELLIIFYYFLTAGFGEPWM